MRKTGFTIIELILYVGIVSILLTGITQFTINLFSIKNKSKVQQEVNDSLRLVANKLTYEIRSASKINSLTSTSLNLASTNSSRNPIVFDLSGGAIRMGVGVGGSCPSASPCNLTPSNINISNLTFTNLSSGDTKTINIRFQITADYLGGGRSEFTKSSSITGSAELRSK